MIRVNVPNENNVEVRARLLCEVTFSLSSPPSSPLLRVDVDAVVGRCVPARRRSGTYFPTSLTPLSPASLSLCHPLPQVRAGEETGVGKTISQLHPGARRMTDVTVLVVDKVRLPVYTSSLYLNPIKPLFTTLSVVDKVRSYRLSTHLASILTLSSPCLPPNLSLSTGWCRAPHFPRPAPSSLPHTPPPRSRTCPT